MSSGIWTLCAGASELRPLRLEPLRAVEAQHQVSTRRLVDSDAEQQLLERLIDDAKPPERAGPRLHYLLSTPFRYPPLPHGSRFGSRTRRGIWYGAESPRTAFAEVAYYRLLFLEGTTADLGPVRTELTSFTTTVKTERGIDLTASPFSAHEAALSSPDSYEATQALGDAMREEGVEVVRYRSARDIERGTNVAVLDPAAFGRRQPRAFENWHCIADRDSVEVTSRRYIGRSVFHFARAEFLVRGRLPAPAI